MRYPKDHKDLSRQRLLAQGGRHAKRHGFEASGMAALAGAAGVTTGALYKHFGGKSDFFAALVTAELARTAGLYGAIAPDDDEALSRTLRGYLSLAHVRRADAGCPLPSLAPEVARADDNVKAAFQTGLREVHARLQGLTGSPESAWALMAQNVGALMLARALPDEALQEAVLAAARQAADRLMADAHKPATPAAHPRRRPRRSKPA